MERDDVPWVRGVRTADELVAALRETIAGAEREVMLAIPPDGLDRVADALADALGRDVFVWLVVYGEHGAADTTLSDVAAVARTWPGGAGGLVTLVTDRLAGVVAPERMLQDDPGNAGVPRHTPHGTAFRGPYLEHFASVFFVAQVWSMGREVVVPLPTPLPRTFDLFRRAVLEATLHLRRRQAIVAAVDASPTDDRDRRLTVTGTVINARQRAIAPSTSSFVGETALVLRTDEGRVTVGGPDAFVEDYEAHSVSLSLRGP